MVCESGWWRVFNGRFQLCDHFTLLNETLLPSFVFFTNFNSSTSTLLCCSGSCIWRYRGRFWCVLQVENEREIKKRGKKVKHNKSYRSPLDQKKKKLWVDECSLSSQSTKYHCIIYDRMTKYEKLFNKWKTRQIKSHKNEAPISLWKLFWEEKKIFMQNLCWAHFYFLSTFFSTSLRSRPFDGIITRSSKSNDLIFIAQWSWKLVNWSLSTLVKATVLLRRWDMQARTSADETKGDINKAKWIWGEKRPFSESVQRENIIFQHFTSCKAIPLHLIHKRCVFLFSHFFLRKTSSHSLMGV